jgi:hypothetical protein
VLETQSIINNTRLKCEISRLNVIVIYQATPVYTISLLDIEVTHKSELFVAKYHLSARDFYVVDISENCGLHPIIAKAATLDCYLTLYES